MCVLTWQSSETMSWLSTSYTHLDENDRVFYMGSLLKTTMPGFQKHPLKTSRNTDQSLRVITYIKRYLLETKELKHSDHGFFVSLKPPHQAVTSTTSARWVENVLNEAGINVSLSSAHSARSESSSKSSDQDLNLVEISKAAGWSICNVLKDDY